jgi:hypothetical protein
VFFGSIRATVSSSSRASFPSNTMPFTQTNMRPLMGCSTAQREYNQLRSCNLLTHTYISVIFMATLYIYLWCLVAQRKTSRVLPSAIYIISMLTLTAILSLTAQGTSNFFNSDAAPSTIRSNLSILKASFVLLLFVNVCFLGILAWFPHRSSSTATSTDNSHTNIKPLVITLCIIGTLMLARNIFRTVQIFSHSYTSVWKNETFFWVFDAAPLLLCTALLNLRFPGSLVSLKQADMSRV